MSTFSGCVKKYKNVQRDWAWEPLAPYVRVCGFRPEFVTELHMIHVSPSTCKPASSVKIASLSGRPSQFTRLNTWLHTETWSPLESNRIIIGSVLCLNVWLCMSGSRTYKSQNSPPACRQCHWGCRCSGPVSRPAACTLAGKCWRCQMARLRHFSWNLVQMHEILFSCPFPDYWSHGLLCSHKIWPSAIQDEQMKTEMYKCTFIINGSLR